jgi:hypothetical protein
MHDMAMLLRIIFNSMAIRQGGCFMNKKAFMAAAIGGAIAISSVFIVNFI